MLPKIIIVLQDDWELMGDGTGNVAGLQYLPLVFLLKLADNLNFKMTFNVEVLQQLAFKKFSHIDRNLLIQANIWDNSVLLMKEKGHDVQLHLHPQWYQCKYEDDNFILNNNWNIATYERPQRQSMIASGISYLEDLITPIDPSYKVTCFKAGSWALQPSEGILEDLESFGIIFVIGPGKGIKYVTNSIYINYDEIEEAIFPYYPDYSDINKISNKEKNIIILPLPFYKLSVLGLFGKTWESLLRPTNYDIYPKQHKITHIKSPMGSSKTIKQAYKEIFCFKTYSLPASSLEEMKEGIDQIISRVLDTDNGCIPIIIQTHTKAYPFQYNNVRLFMEYIVNKYCDITKFSTLTELLSMRDNLHVKICNKK